MGDASAIEWTDATWNTCYGCDKVSPACARCYIERSAPYRVRGLRFERGHIPVQLLPERLEIPLHWTRPRRIFVNSLSDTFHDDVPDEYLDKMFGIMELTPQHTYQVLTKRPERAREYLSTRSQAVHMEAILTATRTGYFLHDGGWDVPIGAWPLPNVILMTTAENQAMVDARVPVLLDTPAAMRGLSIEPLLGPVDLTRVDWTKHFLAKWAELRKGQTPDRADVIDGIVTTIERDRKEAPALLNALTAYRTDGEDEVGEPGDPRLDWVIVGGESAGPKHRRLVERCDHIGNHRSFHVTETSCSYCHGTGWRPKSEPLAWVRSLRIQCVAAGVPFFFKQWGGPKAKSGGRLLDGAEWSEFPA